MKFIVRFEHEGGWINPYVPTFDAMTQARDLDGAMAMVLDLIATHLELRIDDSQGLIDDTGKKLPKGCEWVPLPSTMEVALRIRQMRKEAGLSVREAAEAMGVKAGTYQRWENPAKCNAKVETLEKVAEAFGKRLELAFV